MNFHLYLITIWYELLQIQQFMKNDIDFFIFIWDALAAFGLGVGKLSGFFDSCVDNWPAPRVGFIVGRT